jgi:protein TonB
MFSFSRSLLCSLFLAIAVSAVASEIHSDFDVKPLPVRTPPPEYPAQMRASNTPGVVLLAIVLDAEGSVESCDVVRASDQAFVPNTIAAVKRWKFKPAQKGGEAVRARFQLPVQFSSEV